MLSKAELQHIVLAKLNNWTEFYPVGRDAEMAEELLSLREQLAELKALEPIGQIVLSDYDSDGTRSVKIVCLHEQADWDNFQDGTLLFTAAKPAED